MVSISARADAIVAAGTAGRAPSTHPRRGSSDLASPAEQSGCQVAPRPWGARTPGASRPRSRHSSRPLNRPPDDPGSAAKRCRQRLWLITTASTWPEIGGLEGSAESGACPGVRRTRVRRARPGSLRLPPPVSVPRVNSGRMYAAICCELPALLLPVAKVQVGGAVGQILLDVLCPHHRDPVGLVVRQIAQHHRLEHAENRGVGADAERQCQNRDGGEAGVLGKRSEAVAEVLDEGIHRRDMTQLVPAGSSDRSGAGLHFRLCAQDGAPVLVLGQRHPALRANANALLRWLVLSKQTLQQ